MKAYWDSSALVKSATDLTLHARLVKERGFARTHVINEVFAAFAARLKVKMHPDEAHRTIMEMAGHLDFVDLTAEEMLRGLADARARNVMGGRVHDYAHALAAAKSGADTLLTTDRNDFDNLVPGLKIEQL